MGQSKVQRPDPKEPERLSCDMCKKEIPGSVAHTREGPDYILHFCGIHCLDEWKRSKGEEETEQGR